MIKIILYVLHTIALIHQQQSPILRNGISAVSYRNRRRAVRIHKTADFQANVKRLEGRISGGLWLDGYNRALGPSHGLPYSITIRIPPHWMVRLRSTIVRTTGLCTSPPSCMMTWSMTLFQGRFNSFAMTSRRLCLCFSGPTNTESSQCTRA